MKPEQLIERIQKELQLRFQLAGHGSVSRVERALEVGSGYFRDQRRPGRRRRVELRMLLRALDELGVDPSEFFAAALGAPDPVAAFGSEAAALRQRLKRLPQILMLVAERPVDPPGEEIGDLVDPGRFRDQDPKQVMRWVRSRIGHAADPQVPALLGIHASACQDLGRLDEAQVVLAHALELAGDLRTEGDLLLRCSSLVAEHDQIERSLALAEKATLAYVRCGDPQAVARGLARQGSCFFRLERFERAVTSWRSALDMLPQDGAGDELRRSCLRRLEAAYRRLGDEERAQRFAARAGELAAGAAEAPKAAKRPRIAA